MAKKNFKILQLDGGGLLGTIFLVFLVEIENRIGVKISEHFDMFIGTSTGGIAAALFSIGFSAKDVLDFYKTNGKKIFAKRFLGFVNPTSWWSGQYDRKYIDGLCNSIMNKKMGDLDKIFICTGVNMKDDQDTHFFKSYKDNYKDKLVGEMVKRTYSAPTYFGYYNDSEGMWSDGGVGVHTCTLLEAYIEAKRLKKDNYYILSMGCGDSGAECDGTFIVSQVANFIPIARRQSITSQVNIANELSLNFDRVNVKIKKEHDQMDNWKLMPVFEVYGNIMIKENINNVVSNIK